MPTYTIKQVAAELQVSIPTVERWIKAKKINVIRLGYRTVRITDEELNRIKREGLEVTLAKGDKCDRCGKRSHELLPAYDSKAAKGTPTKNPDMICMTCAGKE